MAIQVILFILSVKVILSLLGLLMAFIRRVFDIYLHKFFFLSVWAALNDDEHGNYDATN